MSGLVRPQTSDIPESAGVYLFRDQRGEVLYVGKAKSLRHRVPSYFGLGRASRAEALAEEAASLEWIVTASEVEALQLEVTLIKQHQPRYNVRYRDDKSYPYLAVTLDEEIPRALVTRGRKRKGVRYFGPFAHAYAIRDTLDLLLRVFPIRSCSQGVFDRARRSRRPCLLYDIGRCSAPCVSAVSAGEHRTMVEAFCRFMDGDHEGVVASLETRMAELAGVLEFEQAARIRDKLGAVRKVLERQTMVTERPEDLDAISFHGDDIEGAFQVFYVRGGRVTGRKGLMVDRVEELTEPELAASFLENFYADSETVPPEILLWRMPQSPQVLEQWLADRRGARVRLRVPQRGSRRKLLETVGDNAREAFAQARLKRASDFAARSRALSSLQAELRLPAAPLRIECFDISNLGPSEVVASMVVFEDAVAKKSDYRKFKVRSFEGQDDVGAMGEVIQRRFTRFLQEGDAPLDKRSRFSYEPGLVVLDGGKGQLNRAQEEMASLGLGRIPMVALAKRLEEVFIPGQPEPLVIPRGSEALYLLQRIRDEAHRFALAYQRSRRTGTMVASALDELPGIGPARRSALIRAFGSLKGLMEADAEKISRVSGIGPELAGRIHESLHA